MESSNQVDNDLSGEEESLAQLMGKCKSKIDVYSLLKGKLILCVFIIFFVSLVNCLFILPHIDNCPREYFQAIMNGSKNLLHTSDAHIPIEVPRYNEFRTQVLVEILMKTDGWSYHPELKWSKRSPERKFVITLLSTFARDYLIEIVRHANA